MATCEGGQCGFDFVAQGTLASNQVAGDCQLSVCDGAGVEVAIDDLTDLLDDGKECTVDVCEVCGPLNVALPAGTPCPQTAGMYCDGAGECVECTEGAHCASSLCGPAGQCQTASCSDQVQNGDETDVDCGGPSCAPCGIGEACVVALDCSTGSCADGVCCDAACDSACMACVAVKTGGADGACLPIPAGEDPDDDCDPQPASTCGDSTGLCNGSGACEKHPAGTVCRASAGACDVAETCDGSGTGCPADLLSSAGTMCRQASGPCDVAETCTGSSPACPPDVAASPSTVCRSASSTCDISESCDGSSKSCPQNVYAPPGTVCASATCSGSTLYKADTCNGSGTCVDGGSTYCVNGPYPRRHTVPSRSRPRPSPRTAAVLFAGRFRRSERHPDPQPPRRCAHLLLRLRRRERHRPRHQASP